MIQTILRPFTSEERTEVLDQISAHLHPPQESHPSFASGLAHAWNGFLYGCAAALILLLIGKPAISAWLCILAAVVIRLAFYLSDPQPSAPLASRATSFVDLLRRDVIEETAVVASGVVAVHDAFEEKNDGAQAVGYFFDIGGNEVLFLPAEYLPWEASTDTLSLPSVFTMIRYPDTGDIVRIIAAGPDLPLSRILRFVDEDTIYTLENGAVFPNACLETLEQDLPELVCVFPEDEVSGKDR